MKKLMMPMAVGLLMLGADRHASASTLGFGALADLSDLFGEADPLASFGNFAGATGTRLAFSHPTFATSDHFCGTTNDVGDGVFGDAHRSRLEPSEVPPPPVLLLLAMAPGGMAVIGDRRLRAQV